MNNFRKYEKIHRLGKDEVDGILEGKCHIMEKIDGANLQIWKDGGGAIHVGSRNNDVTGKDFNGATAYVLGHEGITRLLEDNPGYHLYGEWLVKHTIDYRPTAYKKFYLFDILSDGNYLSIDKVVDIAEKYGISYAPYHGIMENPTVEKIKELVGKTEFGDRGEGVVIKNMEYKNPFGDITYAKIVCETFKEDNGVVFGGNNKSSDCYWEMYVVNKYITVARIEKIMNKLQPLIDKKLDMEHIPRVMETVYHDMLTEEVWEIAKKVKSLNFDNLKRISNKKTKQVYVDILNNTLSVADAK